MTPRAALMLAGAALAACNLEFVGPESPAQYDVIVTFTDSVSTRSTIQATLSPGFTSDGEERPVPDDTIRVWDQTLAPIGIDEDGVRSYDGAVEADPRTLPSPIISTQPPMVGGTAQPSELSLALVWRAGPAAITVPRDTNLVLRIVNAAGLDTLAEGTVWSLVLRDGLGGDVRTVFRTASLGLPPEQLIVPVTTLATEAPILRAELEASYFARSETFRGLLDGGVDYVAELQITANLYWILHLTGTVN